MEDFSPETWVSPTLMRKKREFLALSWSSASAWKTLKTNGPENKHLVPGVEIRNWFWFYPKEGIAYHKTNLLLEMLMPFN